MSETLKAMSGELVNDHEFAELLSVCVETFRSRLSEVPTPTVKLGRKRLWHRDVVAAYLREGKK
jgi:hypothetical protein